MGGLPNFMQGAAAGAGAAEGDDGGSRSSLLDALTHTLHRWRGMIRGRRGRGGAARHLPPPYPTPRLNTMTALTCTGTHTTLHAHTNTHILSLSLSLASSPLNCVCTFHPCAQTMCPTWSTTLRTRPRPKQFLIIEQQQQLCIGWREWHCGYYSRSCISAALMGYALVASAS